MSSTETGMPTPRSDAGLGRLGRLSHALALAGGLLSLCVAFLVLASILLRQTRFGAVPGDFELVQMGTALAIFAFLPWCQARRGNVMVDTFTSWLPRRAQAALDALWDVVFALMMAMVSWRLALGALDAINNHTTTMVLQVPLGPAILGCAALAACLAVVSLATAVQRWMHP
jgi:TRAP-type C4-dicarboxylate transport system permease small subunit